MKKTFKQIISFVLVFVLVFQLMPLSVFADELEESRRSGMVIEDEQPVYTEVNEGGYAAEYTAEDVLWEIESLRTETEKHFRMKDGTNIAVAYTYPVHYQDVNGIYQEIDNSLALYNPDGTLSLDPVTLDPAVNENGMENVPDNEFELSSPDNSYSGFYDDNQTNSVDDPFASDVDSDFGPTVVTSSKAGVGKLQKTGFVKTSAIVIPNEEIDPYEETPAPTAQPEHDGLYDMPEIDTDQAADEMEPDAGLDNNDVDNADMDMVTDDDVTFAPDDARVYKNIKGLAEVSLAAISNAERLATISYNGYSVSLTPKLKSVSGGIVRPAASLAPVVGTVRQIESVFEPGSFEEKIMPRNLTSAIMYENLLGDADLEYIIGETSLKENIILDHATGSYEYSFVLDPAGLTPVEMVSGTIELRDENDKSVFFIPAGYMYDENGETSMDVEYVLDDLGDGTYLLTVIADREWIEASERAFPVTIDPPLFMTGFFNVETGTLFERYPNGQGGQVATESLGYYSEYGKHCRMLVRVNNLPTLPDNSYVVNSGIYLYEVAYSDINMSSLRIQAQALTTNSPTEGYWCLYHTWNDCPKLYSEVIDYVDVPNGRAFFGWNVTGEAIKWYNNPSTNYGICLKATKEGSMNSSSCANVGFASSNTSNAGARPYFVVEYRNNVGLEGYYTYQSHNIDRAGTGYIGDYSGQLTLIKNDVTAASTVNAVDISHVYNSAYSSGNYSSFIMNAGSKYGSMNIGLGWMLNIQQTVSEYDNGYVLYADGDGTVHFFYQTATNTYKDEDGLGLTLTKSGSNYTITDKKNNISYFTNGMLSYTQDANGNRVNYVRNGSNQVTSVTRLNSGGSTETIATLSYNGSGYLTSITDSVGNTTSYTYTSNRLTSVTHADGTTVSYTYDSKNKLTAAVDNETNYSLNYEYNSQTGKVSRFYEKGGTEIGGEVIADGSFNGTQTYRSNGTDRIINNPDDIVTGKVFDYFGRTISGYSTNPDRSELYGASSTRYSTNSGTSATNNRALVGSSVGTQAENYVTDGGIEGQSSISASSTPWSFSGGGTASVASGKAHTGNRSLSVSRASGQAESVFSQNVSGLTADKWYVVSAYVNTSETTVAGEAFIRVGSSAGTPVSWNSGEIGEGWERIYLVAQASSSGTLTVQAVSNAADGAVYFDDFQVEPAMSVKSFLANYTDKLVAPSSVNLLSNGNMAANTGWTFSNTNRIGYVSDSSFGRAIRITGDSYSNLNASQTVNINLPGTQTYFYSGWAKASSVPLTGNRSFTLRAVIKYSDNTEEVQSQNFSADSTQWQYNVLPIVPKESTKTVSTIRVEFTYNLNPNTVYFANAALTREEAQSYKYNSDGELVSVTSPGNEEQTYSYNGADLISQVIKGSGKYTYEYDSKHNMTKATNNGLSMSASYDAKGNTTGTTLSATDTSKVISTSAAYDANGNLLTSQTDARGNTTNYAYDSAISKQMGSPSSVTDAKGATQKTTYDSTNGRAISTEIDGKAKVENTYTSGHVTKVSNSGSIPGSSSKIQAGYELRYDNFGNVKQVNYTGYFFPAKEYYRNKNGPLFQITRGGSYVYYGYDALERMAYVEDWDNFYLLYAYTGSGMLGRITDLKTNREYNYTYDGLDRLSAMTEYSNGAVVQTFRSGYDDANRVTKVDYKVSPSWSGILGAARSYGYTYDNDDGTLTSMALPENDSFSYDYDALKRLNTRTLSQNNAAFMTREYEYLPGAGSNGTTLLVSGVTNKDASGNVVSQFSYTYDAVGNITNISGSTSASYTYDEQGQLLTETIGDRKYTYTYDGLGNIRSKSLTVNGVTTTDTFGYNNSSLPGFLSDYNGKAINYGIVGMPDKWYNGNTMYYDRGIQLSTAFNTDTGLDMTFTYDADNLRLTKTNGDITHKYTWQSDNLIADSWGNEELEFFYDESDRPYAFTYKANASATPVLYYYVTNLQGDILGIVDSTGTVKASYTYNAWGELISSSGDMADINPLRYRGYYYDEELGFYYLHNRYYDPVICRFISPDDNISTGQGVIGNNMFAYCGNNPVSRDDSGGEVWHMVIGAAVGVATQYLSDVGINLAAGKSFREALTSTSTWADYGAAALSGALAATGIGAGASIVANATIGGASYLLNCNINGERANFVDFGLSVGIGAFAGRIGGEGADANRIKGVISTSKQVLQTAVSPKKIAMYTAKINNSIRSVVISGIRTISAGVVSNAFNTARKWLTKSAA